MSRMFKELKANKTKTTNKPIKTRVLNQTKEFSKDEIRWLEALMFNILSHPAKCRLKL